MNERDLREPLAEPLGPARVQLDGDDPRPGFCERPR
jgi:hypothetical protein